MSSAAEAAGGSWSVMQQLGVQAVAVLIAVAYSAILTLLIVFVVSKLVGFKASKEAEMHGLDGEQGYGMLNPR